MSDETQHVRILRLLDTLSLGFFVSAPVFIVYLVLFTHAAALPWRDGLLYVSAASLVIASLHLRRFADIRVRLQRTLRLTCAGFAMVVVVGFATLHPTLRDAAAARLEAIPAMSIVFKLGAATPALVLIGFFWFAFSAVGLVFISQLLKENAQPPRNS